MKITKLLKPLPLMLMTAIFLSYSDSAMSQTTKTNPLFNAASFNKDPLMEAKKWISELEKNDGKVEFMVGLSVITSDGYPNIKIARVGEVRPGEGGIQFYIPSKSKTFQEITKNPNVSAMIGWKAKGDNCGKLLRIIGKASLEKTEKSIKSNTDNSENPVDVPYTSILLKPHRIQFVQCFFGENDKSRHVNRLTYYMEKGKWNQGKPASHRYFE